MNSRNNYLPPFPTFMPQLKLILTAIFVITAILFFKPEIAVADTAPKITVDNWYWGPDNEWSYKHTRRIFPSAAVYRGTGPVSNLDYQIRDIDSITFRNPSTGKKMTVADMYAATNTDAFLVMKGGKIITERYFNGMRPHDTHLLMSVTKSVVGSLAGIVVEQGHLDPSALVTDYVPEVEGTAYEGATVRHVLDMSVGLDFDEDYSSKTSDLYRLDEAAGWVPRGPNASNGLHEYLTTLTKKKGQHGDAFLYASPTTDLMGWILERATNMDFAELLSRELWSKLGAERDAYVLLDGFQNAYTDLGLNTTLRDLGRFSQMMLQNGLYRGERIVPEEWIQDFRRNGDQNAWKNNPKYQNEEERAPGYKNGSYRSYWYVTDPEIGRYAARGLAGQLIVIDPSANVVIVKFSSNPAPGGDSGAVVSAATVAIIETISE